MLNKLLKRCMPWMDKGRWYKITLEPSDNRYVIGDGTDPVFQNTVVHYNHIASGDYTIDLSDTGIAAIELKIRAFDENYIQYLNCVTSSSSYEISILMPANYVIKPDYGMKIEIMMFGREIS